jgi:acyl carrier protein
MFSVTSTMKSQIREIIFDHAGIDLSHLKLEEDTDLYKAGMKSFASVQLMLALEDVFDVEFTDAMLKRTTFRSPAAIEKAIQTLKDSSESWSVRATGVADGMSSYA